MTRQLSNLEELVVPAPFMRIPSALWPPGSDVPVCQRMFVDAAVANIRRSLHREAAESGPNESGFYEGTSSVLNLLCLHEGYDARRAFGLERALHDNQRRSYLSAPQPRVGGQIEVDQGTTLQAVYQMASHRDDGDYKPPGVAHEYPHEAEGTNEGITIYFIVCQS